jgi:hypothetical protein
MICLNANEHAKAEKAAEIITTEMTIDACVAIRINRRLVINVSFRL